MLEVKICGVTRSAEMKLLDELGVTYAGLWYGVKDGKYSLTLERFRQLALLGTDSLKVVMVTMLSDIDEIMKPLENSNVHGIQLHGFQLPNVVSQLRQKCGTEISIFKVLHIHKDVCLEENMIQRYLECGVNSFILDNFESKDRIGSTGQPISMDYLDWYNKRWRPTTTSMLAGGLCANNIRKMCRRYKPDAVDIDSAARFNGYINRRRVRNIMLNI